MVLNKKGLSTLTIVVIALIIAIILGFLIFSGSAFQLGRGTSIGAGIGCSQVLRAMCADYKEQTNGLYDPGRYPTILQAHLKNIEDNCKREEVYCDPSKPGCRINLNDVGNVIVYCCGSVGGDISVCRPQAPPQ
ncbi:MAG: hypothetical protein QXQ18_00170 [Candidatus Aenigmatarchaeota archaeon]